MKVTLEQFFKNTRQLVLYRGIRYYQEGRIQLEKQIDNTYYFDVQGEQNTYHVVINVSDDDKIVFSSCDCPYSDAGYCKHQVAGFMSVLAMSNRLLVDQIQQGEGLKEKNKKNVPSGWSPSDYEKLQKFDVAKYLDGFTKDELMYLMVTYMKHNMNFFMYIFQHFLIEEEKEKIKNLS